MSGKKGKWYFGGLASAGAACFTHPLDLLKVQLQTQQEGKSSVLKLTTHIIKTDGVLSLYNGISASLMRQLTYSTARFGIYEVVKGMDTSPDPPFWKAVVTAGAAGAAGGVVGTPADLVNVRMQNDIKLPADQRRNYKNAIDGLIRVTKEEGATRMFSGLSMATSRAVFMTIGQLSFYDLFKKLLLESNYFEDNPTTHFLASLMAGGVATTLTQPLDVMKTRAMNAKPGEFKGLMDIFLYTAKLGPLGFFKGYVPAFVRLAPQTILTFLFLEQLKQNFGVLDQRVVALEHKGTTMVNNRIVISNALLAGACIYGFVSGAVSGKMYATVGLVLYTASGVLVIAAECVNDNDTLRTCRNHAHRLAMVAGIDLLTTDVCIASGVDEKLALLNLVPPAVDLLMYYAVDSSWDPITSYTHIVSIVLHAYFGIRDTKYILCVSALAFLFAIFGSWDYQFSYVQIFNAIGVFSTEWFLAGKDIQELNIFK